jgi:hypothetical protein
VRARGATRARMRVCRAGVCSKARKRRNVRACAAAQARASISSSTGMTSLRPAGARMEAMRARRCDASRQRGAQRHFFGEPRAPHAHGTRHAKRERCEARTGARRGASAAAATAGLGGWRAWHGGRRARPAAAAAREGGGRGFHTGAPGEGPPSTWEQAIRVRAISSSAALLAATLGRRRPACAPALQLRDACTPTCAHTADFPPSFLASRRCCRHVCGDAGDEPGRDAGRAAQQRGGVQAGGQPRVCGWCVCARAHYCRSPPSACAHTCSRTPPGRRRQHGGGSGGVHARCGAERPGARARARGCAC